jgi:hypothetical protein
MTALGHDGDERDEGLIALVDGFFRREPRDWRWRGARRIRQQADDSIRDRLAFLIGDDRGKVGGRRRRMNTEQQSRKKSSNSSPHSAVKLGQIGY